MPIRKRKRHVLCLHLHIHTDTNTCFNEPNSPSAAGAKRLARTSRRAVNMASSSSSYRPLLKVPDKFSTAVLLANAPAGCFLYGTDPSTAPHFPQDRSKPCCSDSRCLPKSVRNKTTTKKQHAYELNRRQEVNEVWDLKKLLGEQSDCCLFQ